MRVRCVPVRGETLHSSTSPRRPIGVLGNGPWPSGTGRFGPPGTADNQPRQLG
jgi:hypothetical protein